MTGSTSRCPSPNLLPVADHIFETISSETLHTGKIFALRKDQVRMPGGKLVTREVVEHYGAVAVVAMDDEGRIPMVYQYRHPFGRRLWELPAGLLDVNGEAPHLTAARELREEAGLQAQTWQSIGRSGLHTRFQRRIRAGLSGNRFDAGRPTRGA